MDTVPLIIDCDPGHDDAIALLLAIASPQIELLGVTTSYGNCSLENATRNAIQILDLAGASKIPVGAGAAGPLTGKVEFATDVHGASGLHGADLPSPTRDAGEETAAQLITRLLEEAAEPVTLAVLGPMTNVATLISSRPDLCRRIKEVIFMGGSTGRGNRTPAAEFNTYADPEALDVLLQSGLQVRMVGLNLTHQALATEEVVQRLAALDHEVGRAATAWMGFFGASYQQVSDFSSPPVHDPCTIAALIRPELIKWEDAFVAVELKGTWTRGATVVDLNNRYPEQRVNAQVAMHLDVPGYWNLILESIDNLGSGTCQ